MELLRSEKELRLFKDEFDIIIDKTLPKFTNIVKVRKKINPKDNIDDDFSVSINYVEVVDKDPDSITPDGFVFLEEEEKNKILKQIGNLKTLKEVVGQENAELFNIKISARLLELIRTRTSIPRNFLIGSNESKEIIIENNHYKNENFKEKLARKINSWLLRDKKEKHKDEEPEKIYDLDVLDLFKEVKIISGKEREFIERLGEYMSILQKSISMRQGAQTEILVSKLIIHVYESILAVSGFNHYITFEDLINLQMRCKKTLDLDYIKNFTRIIPDDAAEKKVIADQLQVFDNYVVLHYNPDGKSFKLTKKEEEIKKDPVLFGVIYGSDKLYYISDWIDEFCDLTFEQVVEKLGENKTL